MFEKLKNEKWFIDRFLVVGDPHLNGSTPLSRIDDYPTTTIKKLCSIRDICHEQRINLVVFLGDVIHKPTQPIEYLSRLIDTFKTFEQVGIQCVSCVGNHSISRDLVETVSKSGIYVLDAARGITWPSELEIHTPRGYQTLRFFSYPDKITNAVSHDDICVAHRFYNNAHTESSLSRELCANLGYSLYLLGHDHEPYPVDMNGTFDVVRPGSMTRGTSHESNLKRTLYATRVDIKKDRYEYSEVKYFQQPASEVFTEKVYHKEAKAEDVDYDAYFRDLMSSLNSGVTSSDIEDVFNSIEIPESVKPRVLEYFRAHGIIIKEKQ